MSLLSTISKDKSQGGERRASPRETLKWVVLSYFNKNKWGQLLDINEGGMLLECAHMPPLRKRITFTFQVMGNGSAGFGEGITDESLTVAGEAVWTRDFERLAGVQFVDLTEKSRQQIHELLLVETSSSHRALEERNIEEKDMQEEEDSPPVATAPLPGASVALSQANGDDGPWRGVEFSEPATGSYIELAPPAGEEIVESPDLSSDDTLSGEAQREHKLPAGSAPRMGRIARISVLSCLVLLALAAASARFIASRQAGAVEPFQKKQSPPAEASTASGTASSRVAGSPRPFQVEVIDVNNRRWVLSFDQNGSKKEANQGTSGPRKASISFPPSGLAIEKKHQPSPARPQEPAKFTLPAPRINHPSTNQVTVESLAAPALGTKVAGPPDGPVVSFLTREVPVPMGGDLQQARAIRSVPPEYPAMAKSRNVAGDVTMDALIDSAGNVVDVKVISGPLVLQRAAEDALRKWKYEPARLDGQPVAVHFNVIMKFRIP